MKNLIYGIRLGLFKSNFEEEKGIVKFFICMYPIISVLISFFGILGFYAGSLISGVYGSFFAMILIFTLIGQGYYKKVFDCFNKFKNLFFVLYFLILYIFIFNMKIKGILVYAILYSLSRVFIYIMINDNKSVETGFYRHIFERKNKFWCGLISFIWLINCVAFLQLIGVLFFAFVFLLYLNLYSIIYFKSKKNEVFKNKYINLFFVLTEILPMLILLFI